MARSVEKVYGNALYQASVDHKNTEALLSEAEMLLQVFQNTPELTQFLSLPDVPRSEKLKKLQAIFQGRVSDEILGLLDVALTKGREQEIPGMLKQFAKEAKEALGIGICFVAAPSELTPEQKNAVEAKLLKTTKYRRLEMQYELDPSLIGGLVIRVGDMVVDSSIKLKLQRMEQDLKKVQLT